MVGILCCSSSVAGWSLYVAWTYSLDLELPEIGNLVHNDKRKSSAKVDDFVYAKRHDACSEHVVLHVGIPCCPSFLKDVEVNVVLGNLVEVLRIRDR